MSHLFEEFSDEEPQYIDLSEIESYDHLRLRQRFESVAETNAINIMLFNPEDPYTSKIIHRGSGEEEIEEREPQLAQLLMDNMLKSINLEVPSDQNDPNMVFDKTYNNGVRATIFTVARKDRSKVPVYFQADSQGRPTLVSLISYVSAHETVLQHRRLDDYRPELLKRLKGDKKLIDRLDLTDLKGFISTFDDIQKYRVYW